MFRSCILLSVLVVNTASQSLVFGPRVAHSGYIPRYWHQGQFSHSEEGTEGVTGTDITCPDGSTCADHDTCCQMKSGWYGCCPLPKADCCSDHIHCCPSGTTCDEAHGKCNGGGISIPWVLSRPSIAPSLKYHLCPDGRSRCADEQTCCLKPNGQYGCCHYPNAVCCSDHIHCCPSGTTCDLAQGKCNGGRISTPWVVSQLSIAPILKYHICPDGRSQCPDGKTCCLKPNAEYGCCPFPNAVCCPDRKHCCRRGFTCDTAHGKCKRGQVSIPWLEKQPAIARTLKSVMCPDGQSECPNGQTCCMLPSGKYGCCPFPEAVCCIDHLHCCPSGTTCDLAQGKCDSGGNSIPWLEKRPSTVVGVKDVICPDGQSRCPDGSTCCKLKSGQYGCCPLPKAVCCSDHLHCCPNGTTCDVAQGKCNRGKIGIPWFEKDPPNLL